MRRGAFANPNHLDQRDGRAAGVSRCTLHCRPPHVALSPAAACVLTSLFCSFNQLMDYCPTIQAYSNGDCRNESNVETDSNSRCPNEYRE